MTKHSKLTVATFALLLSGLMSVAVNAQTTTPDHAHKPYAPKVVFIGDWLTYYWTNIDANPNWINEGGQGIAEFGNGTSTAVLARFQSDVVDFHPQIVHIMVGEGDAWATDDANLFLSIPYLLQNLEAMVKEARTADIKVILGIEPTIVGGSMGGGTEAGIIMSQMNSVIASFGAKHHIPVINYGDALCGCVGSVTPASGIGSDIFDQYGDVPNVYMAPPTTSLPFPNNYPLVVTTTGYAMMTQMAENAISTLNVTLTGGWLQNIEQYNGEIASVAPLSNIHGVEEPAVIQFIPVGLYSDGSQHTLINSNFAGSSGTWTSSNPVVMYITQTGLASALTPGKAIIRYTSPDGTQFAEWVMYVGGPDV